MAELEIIAGVGKQTAELLRAAEFTDVESLAQWDANSLRMKLLEVNNEQKIVKRLPATQKIKEWLTEVERLLADHDGEADTAPIELLQEDEGSDEAVADPSGESEVTDYSKDPDVLAMLATSPVAIPVPGSVMKEQGILPGEIVDPILLTEIREDVEVRIEKVEKSSRRARNKKKRADRAPGLQEITVSTVETTAGPSGLAGVDLSRIKPVEEFMTEDAVERSNSPEAKAEEDERLRKYRLMTATKPETNAGVDKDSRRFVRGVLHPLPTRMFMGAVVTILLMLWVPLALGMAATMLILESLEYAEFSRWWMLIPAAIPLLGFLFFAVANGCRCRVCGQKQFLPKNCLKNRNAHKLPILGYIFPTAWHIILFKWFRCIFCGTPVRIKE